MKRRTFVRLSAFSAVVIGIPSLNCRSRNPVLNKTLSQPFLLSRMCDAKTIREIGTTYREHSPAETKEEQLVALLLTDTAGNPVSKSSDSSVIHSLLERKIQNDFETGSTVIVKGWVLSATEARQCALYSLTQR